MNLLLEIGLQVSDVIVNMGIGRWNDITLICYLLYCCNNIMPGHYPGYPSRDPAQVTKLSSVLSHRWPTSNISPHAENVPLHAIKLSRGKIQPPSDYN